MSWASLRGLRYRLGTGSASSETQTLTRSKPHPYVIVASVADTVEHAYSSRGSSSSTTLALGLIDSVCYPTIFRLCTGGSKLRLDLSLGRWIYRVLRQHSVSTLLCCSISLHLEKHGRLLKRGSGDCRTFLCSVTQAANGS